MRSGRSCFLHWPSGRPGTARRLRRSGCAGLSSGGSRPLSPSGCPTEQHSSHPHAQSCCAASRGGTADCGTLSGPQSPERSGSHLFRLTTTWSYDMREQALFWRRYWLPGLPPAEGGMGRTLVWLGQQTERLAAHPGGTTLWLIFWLLAAYGIAVSIRSRPILALAWLGAPVTACLLAIGRLFPLTDRLALWIVPALYVAIGLAADDSVARARQWLPGRKVPAALASLVVVMIGFLCVDMAQRTQGQPVREGDRQSRVERSRRLTLSDGPARARRCLDNDAPWAPGGLVVRADKHRGHECARAVGGGRRSNLRS